MSSKQQITNSILWAAAIIASCILNDNGPFSVVILPALAISSLLLNQKGCCRSCQPDPASQDLKPQDFKPMGPS